MAGRKLHPEILRRLPQSLPHFYFWSPDRQVAPPDLGSHFLECGSLAAAFAASAPPEKQSDRARFWPLLSSLESALPSLARICGKQRTYRNTKSFRFRTYKKGGGVGPAVAPHHFSAGAVLSVVQSCSLLSRRLGRAAHHTEAHILRRRRAIRLGIRRTIRAAAHHFAFAVAREHPFGHVAAQVKHQVFIVLALTREASHGFQ